MRGVTTVSSSLSRLPRRLTMRREEALQEREGGTGFRHAERRRPYPRSRTC